MASGQTAHYGLSQWEPEDSFLREEFNANFSKIDTEVFSKAEAVTGTYTGDGESARIIELGFSPTAVLLLRNTGAGKDSSNYYGAWPCGTTPSSCPPGRRCWPSPAAAFPSTSAARPASAIPTAAALCSTTSPFAEPEARRAKGPDRRWPSRAFLSRLDGKLPRVCSE